MVDALAHGFAALPVADHFKQSAQDNLTRWLEDPLFAAYRPQLDWLIEQQQWSLLLDRFYRMLPFGTGGRRGPVGIGVNRMNPWTLALSVQGHIAYLRERYPDQPLSVVIAYDVRVFNDLRGLYNPNLPSPLLGMTSRFCQCWPASHRQWHSGLALTRGGHHVYVNPGTLVRNSLSQGRCRVEHFGVTQPSR